MWWDAHMFPPPMSLEWEKWKVVFVVYIVYGSYLKCTLNEQTTRYYLKKEDWEFDHEHILSELLPFHHLISFGDYKGEAEVKLNY